MDAEVPRTLGDLENAEPERRPGGRSGGAKKPLQVFLQEFEDRLRDHPGEAATSTGAALQGRAEGSWRTPVEGGERPGRRLPRRPPWRPPEAGPDDIHPAPPDPAPPGFPPVAGPGPAAPGPLGPEGEASDERAAAPADAATRAAAAPTRRSRRRRRHHR